MGGDVIAALGSRQAYAAISIREAVELDQDLCPNIAFTDDLDVLTWNWEAKGMYTAKSFYRVMMTGGRTGCEIHKVWKYPIPPAVRIFMHLMLQCKILTGDVLQRQNFNCRVHCIMCSDGCMESAAHLLFHYSYAVAIWHKVSSYLGTNIVHIADSVQEVWSKSAQVPASKPEKHRWKVFFLCTCWAIWRNMNLKVFEGKWVPTDVVANWVIQEATLWEK